MRKVNSHGSIIDLDRNNSRASEKSLVDLVEYFNQEHFKNINEFENINTKLLKIDKSLDNIEEYLNTIHDFIRSDKIIEERLKYLKDQNTTIIILLSVLIFCEFVWSS